MKKLITVALLALLFTSVNTQVVEAKRLLPQLKSTVPQTRAKAVTSSVKVAVKLRGDRRAIIVTFSNLEVASKVAYSLIYTSRGIQEGAGGSLTLLSETQTRELLFGTCSSGVCRYHSGIKNARFTVTTTLKNGRKVVKPFKIRV